MKFESIELKLNKKKSKIYNLKSQHSGVNSEINELRARLESTMIGVIQISAELERQLYMRAKLEQDADKLARSLVAMEESHRIFVDEMKISIEKELREYYVSQYIFLKQKSLYKFGNKI